MSRLPDFLVIGAQKAGTTTLYADLRAQPAIGMSSIKEPEVLIKLPDAKDATAYYERLFPDNRAHLRRGEASTHYSQLTLHAGIPERAKSLLGSDLRLIYLVRNPVERAISHHYHAFSRDRCDGDVDQAVRDDPAFVDNGRYAMQLEPWRDVFGPDAVMVIVFEEYVRDRAATLAALGDFLSVPVDPALIDAGKSFNKSEGNRVYGYLRPLLRRDAYRLFIRRAVPERIRQRVRDLVAPKAPDRPPAPRPDTVDWLVERLAPDADALRHLLGRDQPIWDLEATRRKYAEAAPSPAQK